MNFISKPRRFVLVVTDLFSSISHYFSNRFFRISCDRIMRNQLLLIFALFFIASLLAGCSRNISTPSGQMVTIKGDSELEVISYADYQKIKTGLDNSVSNYLGDNSLLQVNDLYYLYKSADGKFLDIETTNNFLLINGELRGIKIDTTNQAYFMDWINKPDEKDFTNLNSIQVNVELDKEQYKTILEIVENNPKVFIDGDYKKGYIQNLASLSKPEFLASTDGEVLELVDCMNVSMILTDEVELTDKINTQKFPSLKRLVFFLSENGAEKILERFPHLEAVSVISGSFLDLSFLKKNKRLKEIHLIVIDSLKDISGLKFLSNIEYVNIMANNLDSIDGLETLANLRALAISGGVRSLEILIKNNPGLTYLNLANCYLVSINNIQNLTALEGLVLGENADELNLEPLKELPKLRFLGLDEKFFSAEYETFLDEVKMICPHCIVYQVQGFCLGAGWILIFVPLLLWFLFVKKRTIQHEFS